jgi:ribosomal-protein-alanine N-acetyltransferase
MDDIDRIMAVMTAAFDPQYGEAWTRRQVEDALLVPGTRYALVNAAGTHPAPAEAAAGFTLSRILFDEEELLLLAVAPAMRRRGLAGTLLRDLQNSALSQGVSRIFLEMREGNPAASIYIRAGYKEVGRRRNYYRRGTGNPCDAITFALECIRKD